MAYMFCHWLGVSSVICVPPPPPTLPHSLILALSGVAVKVAQRCFSLAKCNWRERSTELWFTGPENTDTQGYTPLFLPLCIFRWFSPSLYPHFLCICNHAFYFLHGFSVFLSDLSWEPANAAQRWLSLVCLFFYCCRVVLSSFSELKQTFALNPHP